MKRIIYICLGTLCVALGIIGAFLPVMPTTVFLIMAAYFYARSSERLYSKLMSHPKVGPVVRNWEESRTMPRKAKIIALTMTVLGTTAAMFVPMPWFVKVGLVVAALIMIAILIRIQTQESKEALEKSLSSTKSIPAALPPSS